jgi:ABC-type uncharacterized transport system permease subunit
VNDSSSDTKSRPKLIGRGRSPSWLKTFRLIPCYFWLSLLRSSEFKFNFYSYMFMYGTQILFYMFFWTAVAPPPSSGWSTEACILLTGFGTLNVAIQEIVWATGMIDQMILTGDLTVVMVRPENSYFGLVMRRMAAMALLPASMGLGLIVYIMSVHFTLNLLPLFCSLLVCLLGSVTFRAMLLAVNTLAFRFGKVTAFKGMVLSGRDLARFPLDILPSFMVGLLSSVFPVMMMTNWPTLMVQSVEGAFLLKLLAFSVLITSAWVAFAAWFWKRGLRHYEGQSL